MARFRNATTDEGGETGIDISPLMDCVFILLIFFIVTTVFVEEVGVEVDTPQGASAAQSDTNSMVLRVTAKGQVFYKGRDIGLESVRQTVEGAIRNEDVPVIVKADGEAPVRYGIRVFDQARMAGATKVSISAVRTTE